MLKPDFNTTLIVRSDLPKSISEISGDFNEVEEIDSLSLEQEINLLVSFQDCIIVLDGYDFDFTYQQRLKTRASRLVCIDDIHQYPFLASVIINHGGDVNPSHYSASPWCQYYLGPAYALLRSPFRKTADGKIKNQNLFICLGGSDPHNHTLQILTKAIAQRKYSAIQVVVGNGYQYISQLKELAGQQNVITHQGISSEEMASLMQSCTYAVCSPSSVAYEYLSVGSILFLVQTAENQSDIYKYLLSSKLALDWNESKIMNDSQIEEIINRKQHFFDGKQEDRLRNIFQAIHAQQSMVVRKVAQDDTKLCYTWANDPQVRQNSYTQEPISWETHVAWFNARLSDEHSYFYILELESMPMAQIRFQVQRQTAVLNYLIDSKYRGKGLGSTVISLGIKKFLEDFNKPVAINAHVKISNPASQRAFEKMKFVKQVSPEQEQSLTYSMVYNGSASWK